LAKLVFLVFKNIYIFKVRESVFEFEFLIFKSPDHHQASTRQSPNYHQASTRSSRTTTELLLDQHQVSARPSPEHNQVTTGPSTCFHHTILGTQIIRLINFLIIFILIF
jgi:hypothetical protein